MNDARKGKHPVCSALLVATLVSAAFAIFLPFILYAVMIAMIPGISDLAWGIAQFPVKLLSLPLPASDSAGYTFNVAGSIYAALAFFVVFALKIRQGHKQRDLKTDESNDA